MDKIKAVRRGDLEASISKGVSRSKAFETQWLVQVQSRIEAGGTTAWHHHGNRELFGFMASGRMRLEDASGDAVEVEAGDFFRIPAGLVHRDVNLDRRGEAVVVGALLGTGTTMVEVDDPKRGAKPRKKPLK